VTPRPPPRILLTRAGPAAAIALGKRIVPHGCRRAVLHAPPHAFVWAGRAHAFDAASATFTPGAAAWEAGTEPMRPLLDTPRWAPLPALDRAPVGWAALG
jgi:hypothetical protein